MIKNAEEIKKIILEKSGLSKEEVDGKINKKLEELSGLVSYEGAVHIVASELNIGVLEEDDSKEGIKVENNDNECVKCGEEVKNQKTIDFSIRKHGEIICWNCQQGGNTAASKPVGKPALQQEFQGELNVIQLQMIHKDTVVMLAASEFNPLSMEFSEIYNKTFNSLMVEFRKKLKELGNSR